MPTDHYQRTLAHLGWDARPEQARLVRLLRQVAHAPDPTRAVVQAGTGVGKSLAALTVGAEVGAPGRPALILIVTNNLARQYTGHDAHAVTAATGARIARVVGATWYVCASGKAGRAAGLPQNADPDGDPETDDPHDPHSNAGMSRARNAWLDEQTADAPWATRWERQRHHGDDYVCPGHPECEGRLIGGCGKRHARGRGIRDASVVISNYHLAAVQTLFPQLHLLPEPVLTVVDEAHALPDTICDILSARIGPGFGAAQSGIVDEMLTDRDARRLHALFDWVQKLRRIVIERVRWRDDPWHTEERATLLSPQQAVAIGREVDTYVGITRNPDPDAAEAAAEADGMSVTGALRLLVASATDRAVVPIVHRPPADPDEPTGPDTRPDTIHLRRADAANFISITLGERAVLMSGTIPTTLPARCGMPDTAAVDVGHPFDYGRQTRGWISRHDGAKSYNRSHNCESRARLFQLRASQLAAFIGTEPALVLCPSHADVAALGRDLGFRMSHAQVFTQPRAGGSEAAMQEVTRFKLSTGPRVLIGVDSLATGLDLPGDLLTRVAWWSLPLGRASVLDAQRQAMHPGTGPQPGPAMPRVGSYLDNRLRVKVAQGIGRLLRTAADHGEILLCDRRFRDHLKCSTTLLDAHLRQIPWGWAPGPEEN